MRGGVALCSAAGFVRSPAKAAQFEFKCASNQGPDEASSQRTLQMWAAVEQESGGRIHTVFYPNSLLGGDAAMFSQLRLGALHFMFVSPGVLASLVPAADICSLGFGFKDEDEGLRVMNAPLGDYIRQETTAKDLHALRTIWILGMNDVGTAVHPIRTPDDLYGLKLRVVQSKITIDLFRLLGASPTPLTFAEVYTALRTRLLDGVAAPLVQFEVSKFYEAVKYVSLTNHSLAPNFLVANGSVWASLPADLKEIVERNNTKYASLLLADTKSANTALEASLRSHGVTVSRVDQTPFRTRLQGYYRSWAATFGPAEWNALESSLGHKLV